jgi:CubicO group peptidase (beta-lactamase class C family)
MTLGDEIKILAKLPLSFQPGTAFGYGWSYDVLGYLVEVVSGKTIDEFFKERIFIPLRMKDTCFFLPEEKLFRFTAVYRPNTGGGLKLADSPSKSSWVRGPKRYFIPRGGLVSTVSDYARFSQMLLNFGELEGVRLLSRKTVELMTMNHTSNFPVQSSLPGDAIEYRYRLGFRLPINMAEVGTIGSEGSYSHSGAFCTLFWIDPKEELILITMTQLTTCNRRFLEDLRVLAYQSIDD